MAGSISRIIDTCDSASDARTAEAWWRCPPTGLLRSHRACSRLADMVALEMAVDQRDAVDPISARRGYHEGNGSRVDVHAAARAERTYESCISGMGRAWPLLGVWAACSRDRSGIRARNRVAHSRGTRAL